MSACGHGCAEAVSLVAATTSLAARADAGAHIGGMVGRIIGGAIGTAAGAVRTALRGRILARASVNSDRRGQQRIVHETLISLGFPAGRPDGVIASRSRSAVADHHAMMGFAATGHIAPPATSPMARATSCSRPMRARSPTAIRPPGLPRNTMASVIS